jgi:hypothetical protein
MIQILHATGQIEGNSLFPLDGKTESELDLFRSAWRQRQNARKGRAAML